MTDQDAKFRLHILVENYATVGEIITKTPPGELARSENLLDQIDNAISGILAYNDADLLKWLELNGKKEEHQLALSIALERLEAYEELSKFPEWKVSYKTLQKKIKSARIQPKRESLTAIAIAINVLNDVDFLSGKRIAGDIEAVIAELFPSFTLSRVPSEKANTLRRINEEIREYRSPALRTGEKEARKLLTNRRDQDYTEALALFRALEAKPMTTQDRSILSRAIEILIQEKGTAEENYKKKLRGRLEDHKL